MTIRRNSKLACVLLVLVVLPGSLRAAATAAAINDGFYVIAESGPVVRTISGGQIHLGERFEEKGIRVAWLRSESNQNDAFAMSLEKDGVFSRANQSMALCVTDYCTTFSGEGSNTNTNVYSIDTWFSSLQAANAYAKFLGTTVKMRAHPGHMLATRFILAKDSYSMDEALPIKLEIKNVGTSDITFEAGGHGSARSNQFGFTAYMGTPVPDTGQSFNLGGLSSFRTLKPGQTFTDDVDLRKWFTFKTPGTYQITGTYELSIRAPEEKTYFFVWQDFAAAQFNLVIK